MYTASYVNSVTATISSHVMYPGQRLMKVKGRLVALCSRYQSPQSRNSL